MTKQAGIAAGQKGYDIAVQGNTHLKGGVIDSSATKGKNTLTTGTLTWKDIENKANYKATAEGRNYSAAWTPNRSINGEKTGGLTGGTSPVKLQPVKGKADSITESAVSEGTINITDAEHQKQDVSDLNRQTKNTLNRLEKIFDKEKVEERQELATEFAKLGAEKIGDIANEKGWAKNDPRRALLHGFLGGITAKLGGNNALSGTMAEGGIEGVQPILDNFFKKYPELREETAVVLGYAIGKVVSSEGEVGAAVSWNGVKFNWLRHEQTDEYVDEMKHAKTEEERNAVRDKWLRINAAQGDNWLNKQSDGDYIDLSGKKGIVIRQKVITPLPDNFDWKSSIATNIIGEEAGLPWILNEKTGNTELIRIFGKYNLIGVGISGTLDLTSDYKDYTGEQFKRALFIDLMKTGIGMGIGVWNPYVGFIAAPILDKLASDIKNDFLIKYRATQEQKNDK